MSLFSYRIFAFYALLALFSIGFCDGNAVKIDARDEIQNLPGLNLDINFKHYSGYLQVSPVHFLHYWFVTSQSSTENDPLIFWFNGGPGCSSIGGGLLTELGPYFVNQDGSTLRPNPDSWNKFANVVFLESPAGVGHSYSSDGNIATNDDQTAKENYEAIKQFFAKHQKFRNHSLYITGESYGGVYVPTLAVQIINGQQNYPLNLEGLAIGNGLLDIRLNLNTEFQFAYYHGFLDENSWQRFLINCCDGDVEKCDVSRFSQQCMQGRLKLMSKARGLNHYDVFRRCESSDELKVDLYREANYFRNNTDWGSYFLKQYGPACINSTAVGTYLNNEGVKQVLHISDKASQWTICNSKLNQEYNHQYFNMDKEIKAIIEANIPVLLYFGDTDMVCNFLMGQKFSKRLGYELKERKKPWIFDGQVAGFKTQYDKNLTYMTILGAGHMAPEWRAPQMNHVIKQFVHKQTI